MLKSLMKKGVFETLVDREYWKTYSTLKSIQRALSPLTYWFAIIDFTIKLASIERKFDYMREVEWIAGRPFNLKIYTRTRANKFCTSCKKLDEDEIPTDFSASKGDLHHAEYVRRFEKNIITGKIKYKYSAVTCDDLLFEPLERWYGSGGEEGSGMMTRGDAQWKIVEPNLKPIKMKFSVWKGEYQHVN